MPVEFLLPELGENVEKGDVVRVLVSVGDLVKKDQPVVELETDKATIEVPSSVEGKISEVRVKAGDKVKVGQAVLILEDGGNGASAAAPKKADAPAPASKSAAASPKKAEEKTEQAREGDDASGSRPSGSKAEVVDIASGRAAPAAPPAPVSAPDRPSDESLIAAAPSVRRYARELGVNLSEVPGSGPGGRVGQQDIRDHVKDHLTGQTPATGRPAALPDFSKWGAVDVKPMSNIRRKTAELLSAAWMAPHVTQFDKADMTALETFRRAYGPRVEAAGAKLTVTVVLVKIVAAAIDRFPQFASSVDMANASIIYKKFRNIGIAVDTPNGLLVPVIRDADRKTLTEVALELGTLTQKAQNKKIGLEEMAGGVFTISNLGGIGGTAFTPIINSPEVAILGVSRGTTEPVWQGDQFVPKQMLPLSLSFDHRVIDGADAARFLRFVAESIEQPLRMQL